MIILAISTEINILVGFCNKSKTFDALSSPSSAKVFIRNLFNDENADSAEAKKAAINVKIIITISCVTPLVSNSSTPN